MKQPNSSSIVKFIILLISVVDSAVNATTQVHNFMMYKSSKVNTSLVQCFVISYTVCECHIEIKGYLLTYLLVFNSHRYGVY